MIPNAPRHSALFSLRESRLGARHYNSVRVTTSQGPGMVPAYSITSDILCCGFLDIAATEGPILTRRIPESQDGKEATSLSLSGGACWDPTSNKFFHGCARLNPPADDGMCVVIDPLIDTFDVVTGFDTDHSSYQGGRTILISGEVWMAWGPGGNGFLKINPTTHAITGVASHPPADFTYVPGTGIYYVAPVTRELYQLTTGGTDTRLYGQAEIELVEGPISGLQFGPIEYISSLGIVIAEVRYTIVAGAVSRNYMLQISGTTVSFYATTGGSILYYTPDFDRIIMQDRSGNLGSWTTDFGAVTILGTDEMTAAKGCYCDSVNKIALPVLTGPPGGRSYTVNFFGSAEL